MSVTKWMKQERLRELPLSELRDRALELKAALFTSRFQRSTGKLDNYRLLPTLKHRYAAVLTLIHERELAEQGQEAG